MVLHLGGDTVVSMKNIIAILDIKTAYLSRINKEFLTTAEEGFIKEFRMMSQNCYSGRDK